MLKENCKLKLVKEEETVICPKCSHRNENGTDRCTECYFPLRDTILKKVVPIQFLIKRR